MRQTKELSVSELVVGGLYYADSPVGGYATIKELSWAIKCYDRMWTQIQNMPPILLNNKEEFMILEIIRKPTGEFGPRMIIQYITTDERMGYSAFKEEERIFHNPIEEQGITL